MYLKYPESQPRQAAAAVEFAVLLIVLVPLLLGLWEVGRLVNAYQVVMNTAREAGRQAATGEKTLSEIRTFAKTYMQNAGLYKITGVAVNQSDLDAGGKVYVQVDVYDDAGTLIPNGDPKFDAEQNYKLVVTVIVLYNDIEISPTNFFLNDKRQVIASVTWHSMKDVPITVNNVIPLQ